LVRFHLRRIAPTIGYAVGQDNNHGTSEAAALFIGGTWLRIAASDSEGARWERKGRGLLEDRINRLVAEDGSFSQYSVNYHRMLLDTVSMVELWRRTTGTTAFSARFIRRCGAATRWLHEFVDPVTGDVPNLGANDGSLLLRGSSTSFRDFRPSVQLAGALFLRQVAYRELQWEGSLLSLAGPMPSEVMPEARTVAFSGSGHACLRIGDAQAFVSFPRFRFRPSDADALHVDLWISHENVLRDGGTFSYAAEPSVLDYFRGTASHNTVQFDERDQMPRIGRFLFGAWLQSDGIRLPVQMEDQVSFAAGYRDWWGAEHRREVSLSRRRMVVLDRVSGFRRKAVLRWRLAPGPWAFADGAWGNGRVSIRITAQMPVSRSVLLEGAESRFYLRRETIPVIEVETSNEGCYRTEVTW